MNEESTLIVTNLAKEFIEYVSLISNDWSQAFFRFHCSGEENFGSSGSFVDSSGRVKLFNPFEQESFFDVMNTKGSELRELVKKDGRSFCVMLLIIDSEFNFDIKFEYNDFKKWKISKTDGLTGVPDIGN